MATIANNNTAAANALNSKEVRHFFISHLNRIYCAKSQLVEKLPELSKRSGFPGLQHAITETVETVQTQLSRIKEIYVRLNDFYQKEHCTGLIGVLDEAFQSIGNPGDSPALRDLSVLFYMQTIESIEIASFKVMLRVAEQLEEKDIVHLLSECYQEAREDKLLFSEISAHYL